ncbi:MAG TPA: oligosaccharide flippase family protein [Allocoleopsis sp.]
MQSHRLSLRHNFSWTFIGNGVYAASQWGMLVVMAKLGTPEMVGQLTLALAVTAPIFMLTNLQLGAVQATDANYDYLFNDYLGLRLIGTSLALLVIASIVYVAEYRWETALLIMIIGLAKAFESISDIFYSLFQQQERMDQIATSMMLKGLLSLVLLTIGIVATGSVLGGGLGLVFAWAIVLTAYDLYKGAWIIKTVLPASQANNQELKLATTLQPRWQIKTLLKLMRLALPLGFVMMLISLNTNIPRFFIERYWSERELGIFSALAAFMMVGNLVIGALGQSATPRLAKHYATGNSSAFRQLLLKLVGIGAVIGAAAVVVALIAGPAILTLFYQTEYAERSDVLVWLMVAAGIGYVGSFLGYGVSATRAYNYLIIPYLIITAIAAGFSQLLIPTYGLVGAAWALCAASLASCVMPLCILGLIARRRSHEFCQ